MCGIAGFRVGEAFDLDSLAKRTSAALSHRGPDDSGSWIETQERIAFIHRRLSIVDLSPEGHQPMFSASGRFVIVFNGEIYNYLDIKADLIKLGYSFRGTSDTEVMLAAFEEWPIEDCLKRFNGMFAFALWDKKEKRLTLARDRLGKKPLYYGWFSKSFGFASELKAFKTHPAFDLPVNQSAVMHLVRWGYVAAPLSIYEGIYKLPPGGVLTLTSAALENKSNDFSPYPNASTNAPQTYWSVTDLAKRPANHSYDGAEGELLDEMERIISSSTQIRMIADVPLGAFLSGGIDSSLVSAVMQKQSSRPIRTYCIGFSEKSYDEAPFAKAIANHLKTDHTELYISQKDTLDVVPRLPFMYDEPLADPSQIPSFLVSAMARKHVTVAITGDGGDELFAGYNRYVWPERVMQWSGLLNATVLPVLDTAVGASLVNLADRLITSTQHLLPSSLRVQRPRQALEKLQLVKGAADSGELYQRLIRYWQDSDGVLKNSGRMSEPFVLPEDLRNVEDALSRVMYWDLAVYLPDDLLAKIDRATMAAALESRAPLLDYRLVELISGLPASVRVPNGEKKHLLRKLLERYIPKALFDRPKMGFSVPIGDWIRGPLRPWAEDLLSTDSLAATGVFNSDLVRKRFEEHQRGVRNWQNQLWTILSYQSWYFGFFKSRALSE